jgi:CBS domain containing-hemolysin-like protein
MFTVFFTITIVRSLFLKIFQNKITSFKNITKYFLPVPFAFFAFVLNTILYVVVIEILGGELQEQSRLGSAMFLCPIITFFICLYITYKQVKDNEHLLR